jgi:hypothetical protein
MLRQRDRRDKLIHLEIPQSAPRVAFLFAWKIVCKLADMIIEF